jgi:hypothetical protein
MTADRESWEAFIGWCEREIADMRTQLEPLENGRMTIGERPYGGQWRDTTQDEIESFKEGIANIESVIARFGHLAE